MLLKWIRPIFCAVFIFLFCFLCVGYAGVSDQLTVTGTIYYDAEAINNYSVVNCAVLDASEAINMTVSLAEQNDTDTLRILLTTDDGYTLPESFEVITDTFDYTIYTADEQLAQNPAGTGFDSGSGILTIHASLLPQKENYTVCIRGEAILLQAMDIICIDEGEGSEENMLPAQESLDITLINALIGMNVEFGTITTSFVQLVLTAEDGYVLPESFTLQVGDNGIVYNVYTSAANLYLNPVGVDYNSADNSVLLQASFLNSNSCTLYISGVATREFPA